MGNPGKSGFAYRVFDFGAARRNEIEIRKGTTNHVSLSIIKADIGTEEGLPIDQDQFRKRFTGALRVLGIRPRPFYNTRHTYISVALTIGSNAKWVAEQCGTSLQMIQSHYAR